MEVFKDMLMTPRNHLSLHIVSSQYYLPSSRPVLGTLVLDYNGVGLTIKVNELDIHACATSFEGNFCMDARQERKRQLTWGEIVEVILSKTIAQMLHAACCQMEYLKMEAENEKRNWYVQ